MIKSSDFDIHKFNIQNLLKNVISKRRRLYVKNTEAKICFILFSNKFSDRFYGSYII